MIRLRIASPRRSVPVLVLTALISACGSSAPRDAAPAPPAEQVPEVGPQTISGRAPAPINGYPAVVVLEPQRTGELPPQTVVPVMDQVQTSFTPKMLLVRTGQPAEFWNNDEVLHNVRIREDVTKAQAFNVAIPTGEKYRFTFDRDGFYDVGCDIHPEMAAQIVATSSPYATLADNVGDFVIDNVPPGPYKAVVYTGAAKIERTITVPVAGELNLTSP